MLTFFLRKNKEENPLLAEARIFPSEKQGGFGMRIQMLHDNWQMCINNTEEFLPAAVPGSVYQDLLDNGRMEDPYYRDNEDRKSVV